MSDTNRVGVAIARSAQRFVPLTAPDPLNLEALRITGTPNLAFNPTTITSNEINPERQGPDLILVGANAGGDTGFELSYGAFDLQMEDALFSSFQSTHIDRETAGITGFGAGTIDVADGTDYLAGHIVELRNLDAADDPGRGVYRVSSIATDTLTCAPYDADTNALLAAFTAIDDDFPNALRGTELQVCGFQATANGEIALTVAGGIATLAFTGSSTLTGIRGGGATIEKGDKIKLAGFATAGNNVWATVTGVDLVAETLTFDAPDSAATDAAASEQVDIFFGDRLINGTEAVSSHQQVVERSYTDIVPIARELFLGCTVNTFSLSLEPQSIMTGTTSYLGFNGSVSQGENAATGQGELYGAGVEVNRLAAPQNDVYNTSNNVGRLGRGPNTIAEAGLNFVLQASMEINNNLREQPAVGVFGAAGIGVGELLISGTLNTYFDNIELLQQVIANTSTSFDFAVTGADGRSISVDLHRIKFTGAPQVPGKNQDVVINLNYQAIFAPEFNRTITVTRFPFAA